MRLDLEFGTLDKEDHIHRPTIKLDSMHKPSEFAVSTRAPGIAPSPNSSGVYMHRRKPKLPTDVLKRQEYLDFIGDFV